jgi:hypothetical protein
MSKPNPTFGRQSSRTDINAQTEESSTEASSEDSSSKTGHKKAKQQPALGQRPRPRAGTWVAAMAGSGAPSSSNKVPKTEEKASEPALSPRGPLPALPRPQGHTAPSNFGPNTSSSSGSTPSTSTPSTSKSTKQDPAGYIKSKVPAKRVPDGLASVLRAGFQGTKSVPSPTNPAKLIQIPVFNIPPKQVARLIVGLESNFFDNEPSSDNLTKPLRDRFGIVGFQVNQSNTLDEINVIEQMLQPFMQRMFNSQEAEQARIEVRERFNAFVSGPHKNLLNTEEGKNSKESTLQNLSFRNQFDTVVQPLESYICGPDRRLESSPLPEEFKSFLKEVVRSYCRWSENKTIPPQDLTNMIKSALIGLLFIRGVLPIWNDGFEADLKTAQQGQREWSQFKPKLSAQLGHYSSFLFDDFLYDIIASTPGKPKAFEEYFKPLQKASELRRKEAQAFSQKQEVSNRSLRRGSTISSPATTSSNKPTNFGSFIQGLVSPRKKEILSTSAVPVSPRNTEKVQSSEGLLLKKAGMRETNAKRRQVQELDKYLKSIELPKRDPGYMRYLNNAIAKRGNYEDFTIAPAVFCLQKLNEYLESLGQKSEAAAEGLLQIKVLLSSVANQEREQAKRDIEQAEQEKKQIERDAQQAKRQAPANTASGRAKTAPKVASVPVPALNFGALVNSPFADNSINTPFNLGELAKSPFADDPSEANEVSASLRTESSDSTEIETESSEDGQVALNQPGLEEKEKNKS